MTLLKVEESRGKEVPEYDGVAAAYNYFSYENRQICWAHLAIDLLTVKMLK
ncbi:hypothetical protein [Wolbachia endosymbiont of Atemnus politus]|uniref:hypothetical protein n=1 Tax=Wolbachia endosymbiont of Atemnus politus TaxID=2682840 RepID=UPI001FE6B559|nr:hypothetical protein [Wolbachia endosymbiont of Atemnus politus]